MHTLTKKLTQGNVELLSSIIFDPFYGQSPGHPFPYLGHLGHPFWGFTDTLAPTLKIIKSIIYMYVNIGDQGDQQRVKKGDQGDQRVTYSPYFLLSLFISSIAGMKLL